MNYPAGKPTFSIKTLGCKVNQYESQAIRESLVQNGFVEKEPNQIADFYIINSCTVTHKADKDTRGLIRHFHTLNPSGKIIVAGCYAELDSDRKTLAQMPGVTHLVKNNEKKYIAKILNSETLHASRFTLHETITSFKERNRAFIKIQDGCNHKCSYCKVSLVRGPSQSRCAEEILKEVKLLLEKGFKELVLTGVCLGAWGRDFKKKENLAGITDKISKIEGNFRIRLSSVEPMYVSDEIIEIVKDNNRVCKHIHVPLQSGDDKILKIMKRAYTARKFTQITAKLKKHIPDIAITMDVLVGFPGEGEKEFHNTVKVIKRIRPSRMHIFSYSRREGTAASKFKQGVDEQAVKERVKLLADLSNDFSMDFARRFIGKKQDAIIESHRDKSTNLLCGYTDKYIRVLTDGPDALKNKLIPLRIDSVTEKTNTVRARLD